MPTPNPVLRSLATLTLGAALSLPACRPVQSPEAQALLEADPLVTKGGRSLVLVGGASLSEYFDQVFGRFIELAGGENAGIGVITAAGRPPSEDPDRDDPKKALNSEANGKFYVDQYFKSVGAKKVHWVPVDLERRANASDPAVVEQFRQFSGFWFGGGSQDRIIQSFYTDVDKRVQSPLLAAMREAWQNGGVVGGTSSGGTVMPAAPMVEGGYSADALAKGTHPETYKESMYPLRADSRGGLGFFRYGVIDTHVGGRGRQGRIIRLAADTLVEHLDADRKLVSHDDLPKLAIGIDESTALIVTNADTPQADMEVIGKNGVGIFDLSEATITHQPCWSITHVRMDYITHGDHYQPATKRVTFAPGKDPARVVDVPPKVFTDGTLGDVFTLQNGRDPQGKSFRMHPRAFNDIAIGLMHSEKSDVEAVAYDTEKPAYYVRFWKDKDSRAADSAEGTFHPTSIASLYLDITCR